MLGLGDGPKYLKGKPTLGLWYSRDSPFELVGYTDSDYAGATQDKKSTIEGCQFLGNRLISRQCKKQIVVATSTTEAEYVAAASCCGQAKHIEYLMLKASPLKHVKRGRETKIPQSRGPLVKVGDEAIHKELGDRMERAATTASSLEAEQESGQDGFHVLDFSFSTSIPSVPAPRNQDSRNKEPTRSIVLVEETTSNALVSQCDGFGYDWSDQTEECPTNFSLMAYSSTSSTSSTNSEIMDKCKTGLGYNAVPPPYTENFMPPKSDLVYPSLDDFVDVNESVSESVVEKPTVETNKPETSRNEKGTPIIED
ncbi:hypothetical protein Tco_1318647 [Tanacetum coccineum]